MKYKGDPFELSRWWKERCLFTLLGYLGMPQSYLDVGCGGSYLIELMGKLIGKENAVGVDIDDSDNVVTHDLRLPLDLGRTFDIVLSLEVGEHLQEESADTYCDTLVKHSGQWLVFSAAHLSQGGWEHINEQPKKYWLEKLLTRGLRFKQTETEEIASAWSRFVPQDCQWAYNNLIIWGVR